MNLIKKVIKEKGVKQTWLAEKLGKSFNIVNDYCNNRIQPCLGLFYTMGELLIVNPKNLLNV
jgi:putative transcriptional regulator